MGHELRNDKELVAATKALLDWFESQGLSFGDATQVMAGALASLDGVGVAMGCQSCASFALFSESFISFKLNIELLKREE
jgi:hypothetical protein